MAFDMEDLPTGVSQFLAERHLASLTTFRPDGSPHVVPVGFTWDPEWRLVRVITGGRSRKAGHVRAGDGRAAVAVCQVDGGRWLTLEGTAEVSDDPVHVADAERRYTVRYRPPRPNPERVVISFVVRRLLGHL